MVKEESRLKEELQKKDEEIKVKLLNTIYIKIIHKLKTKNWV